MRLNTYGMVRPMISRIYAAGLVTIVGLGLILAPNETFGRSGVGRSTLRATVHASPLTLRSQLHSHRFGFGVPLIMPDGSFPYDYEPSDYADPYDKASSADPDMITGAIPDGINPVIAHRTGCRSQTVTVPSETGGERSINIMRC
jgi:hypothetical protein